MEQRRNTLKTLLVVVLFVVLAAVVAYQFLRVTQRPAQQPAGEVPKPAATAEPAAQPPEGTAAPAEGAPPAAGEAPPAPEAAAPPPPPPSAETPAAAAGTPAQPSAQPAAAKPAQAPPPPAGEAAAVEIPRISFMDQAVEKSFRASSFFTVNRVIPAGNPFRPPTQRVPPRLLGGTPQQLGATGQPTAAGWPSAGTSEISLLPLPGEALGARILVHLVAVSQSGSNATALFEVGPEGSPETVMAHPGWTLGNDYVFIGAENGQAKVFDRKANRVIQLATGETL